MVLDNKSIAELVTLPSTLSPLTDIPSLHRGLIAVTFFGLLSLITSTALFLRLIWRLIKITRKGSHGHGSTRINQFVILLTNLIFADIQQSCAFWLNAHWLATNSITINTSTCWAQGWFVSTGDLGSGLFTLAIALHAFADIVFDYRLGPRSFGAVIGCLWIFNYALPVIGIAMHPSEFYARAGAWCWINSEYNTARLYLHYFWVIICEFGTVIIYSVIFLILQRRVRNSFYANSETAVRAQSAAKVIIVYPIVYVVCTLPLVKARLTAMANEHVSFVELCIAGAMITSNGWLDVLLYTLTRSSSIFNPNDDADSQKGVLDTFRHRPDQAFGTTTVIEAGKVKRSLSRRGHGSQSGFHSRTGSTEELWTSTTLQGVKADTTVVVQSDQLELGPLRRPPAPVEGETSSVGSAKDERTRLGKMYGK
ncbi:hypothetical protein LTR09_006383 [Extremus antarcticus]|uniref:G-protein coupled receptors family 2 profile 2 domain-containing protein n=1 Tax=Extremus antarcticus TaxID=702011 RepID=A0AAJ0G8N9_9PEZI|nr:hypothetical protein LTR09_006383 [Extremus antarcticus]